MRLLKYVLLGLVFFIFSCTPKQRKDNDLINKTINQYHKKVTKVPKDSAWYYLKKSEALLSKDMPDSILQEHAYLNGFYRYKVTKEYDSAFYYYEKALTFSKDTFRFQRELNYYYNLAKYYREQKKYEDALYTLNRFEKILNKKKHYRKLGYLYNLKSLVYENLGLFDSVVSNNQKVIDFAMKEKDKLNYTVSKLNNAQYLFNSGKKKMAYNILKDFKYKDYYSAFVRNEKFGDFLIKEKKYTKALNKYLLALEYIKRTPYKAERKYIYKMHNKIIDVLLKKRDTTRIKEYLNPLEENFTSLTNEIKKDYFINKLHYFYLKRKKFDVIKKQLDTTFNFIYKDANNRLNAKFSALEKANKNEKALLIAKQKIALKNKSLKQRQLLLLVVLLLFVFALVIFYLGYQKKQLKQSRDTLLMQQRLFRAQMNPHFTSNVLFAIQNLLHQDVQKTEQYLVKFSRLLRIIFANSTKDFVTIEDELEALHKYLDLQQLRFQHQFEFNILVDKKIEQDLVKIPPMLIQPFVENAIEHGFKNLDKKGILSIEINSLDATFLRCKITDNGNGFEGITSDKISSTKLLKELIFKLTGEKVTIISKKGKGVAISFKIPYIFEV